MDEVHWYEGQLITSNTLEFAIADPALLYGATVFTTLRVYQHTLDHPLTNWQGHCNRLRASLELFGWQQPNWNQLRQGAIAMLAHFPVLRIVVFSDGREWITGRSLPIDLANRQQQGIKAWLPALADAGGFRRSLASHKTGNYLPAWLALQTAQKQGAQEAVLIDEAGNWLETSTGNLWGWTDGQWWTPPISADILPGLARHQLIDWLKRQNRNVGEILWTPTWIQKLEAIAYTNSVVEVVPIHTVMSAEQVLTYPRHHLSFEQLRSFFDVAGAQVF
jgi:branched-subunit amino acid aminotransferase/4-amino-4-deoxychorismate lyase